jgi:radical SAM superfamily enzyme YgiQ (UPF0313 family)
MVSKLKLALAQFGNSYGGQQSLPLSVGCVYSMAKGRGIAKEYEEPTFLYKKESISKSLARLDPKPDVFALSTYVWNWEYSRALAKAVKEVSPYTIIVYGGVHVPDHPADEWWGEHRECDFALHGEGELSFSRFMEEFAGNRDWSLVPGLSNRDGLYVERKFPSVDELRSPYLDGVFDRILPQEARWSSLQETNRGCPY